MKKLLTKLDEWAGKAINFIRPGNHKNSNVLTDDVHVKEKQVLEENKNMADTGGRRERENVVMPEQYIVTRTGQMLRKPSKGSQFPQIRYKFKKRTK